MPYGRRGGEGQRGAGIGAGMGAGGRGAKRRGQMRAIGGQGGGRSQGRAAGAAPPGQSGNRPYAAPDRKNRPRPKSFGAGPSSSSGGGY